MKEDDDDDWVSSVRKDTNTHSPSNTLLLGIMNYWALFRLK
jgi:hypothetical protein